MIHRLIRVLMKLPYSIRSILSVISKAIRMAFSPERPQSYYPDEPRKGWARIIYENLRWALQHGETNIHYFHYGLDRKDADLSDFMSYKDFRRLRDSRNTAPPEGESYNYTCLLRDKFVFAQFASSLGYPQPRTLAVLDSDEVKWLSPRRHMALEDLKSEDIEVDGFCKPTTGIRGRDAFKLCLCDGGLEIEGNPVTIPELRTRLNEQFLLQERLAQHQSLARLHPASLNTMRVVTVLENGEAWPFSAHLRIGAGGHSVDSPKVGGLVVPIDLQSSQLHPRGLVRVGKTGWVPRHPDTEVAFDGYELPYAHNAVDLACRFHEDVRNIHTIGWDIAITPDGPVFVEGNVTWGAMMAFEPDFKRRFLALFD